MHVSKAFMEKLYLNYKELMIHTAGRFFSSQEDQEDVVQDTVLRLLRQGEKLERMEEERIPGYVVFTARSACIDLLRKRSRAPESAWEGEEPADPAALVWEQVILKDELDKLRSAWPCLSTEDQLLLEGKYIWSCTDEELSGVLGCQKDSVRMMLTRARRRALRAMNGGKGGERQ